MDLESNYFLTKIFLIKVEIIFIAESAQNIFFVCTSQPDYDTLEQLGHKFKIENYLIYIKDFLYFNILDSRVASTTKILVVTLH